MRIGLVPYGTRGDVQPFLALAHELKALGHEVRTFASRDFAASFDALGVVTDLLDIDVGEIMRSPEAAHVLAAGDQAAFFAFVAELEQRFETDLHASLQAVADGSDVIVSHGLQVERMAALASERRIPILPIYTFPVLPTGEFANPMVTARRMPFGWLNRLTHAAFRRVMWKSQAESLTRLATGRGFLPPRKSFYHEIARRRLPTLTIHSPAITPRPRDWADHHIVTGHFRAARVRGALGESSPPEPLASFVATGDTPVYLGFGSMPFADPALPLRWAEEVASALGRRVVLVAGFTALPRLGQVSEHVYAVRSVDHDWLMSRCCAAVHHGGVGTVHASLGAGLPTLVVSVFADQPFWGARLERIGAGAHLPFRRATGARIAAAVGSLLRDDVRARAREIAHRMADEDGALVAAKFIHENAGSLPVPEPLPRAA